MEFRLANPDDLPRLKTVYGRIVDRMNREHIQIWDEVYPCEFFYGDIQNERLYVCVEQDEIVSAFALCEENPGAEFIKWESGPEKALYIDRLGVNVRYLRRGVGSLALRRAAALAGEKGAEYLRLFVVDLNEPAISLYRKNGFRQAGGSYREIIDTGLVLRQYGFERNVSDSPPAICG